MPPEPIRLQKPRADFSGSAVLGERSGAARDFAELVASRMVGTVLPFDQRETLIQAAVAAGINRFEANLIIAAVQHQLNLGRRRTEASQRPRLFRRAATSLGLFAIIQAGIAAAVWHWFF
jgi:hypothetical protein